MLTNYSCLANSMQIIASCNLTPEDNCLGLLPLYHIYGMIVVQFSVLLSGASILYLPKFEQETFLRCLQERKITMAHLVPPLIVFLTKHPLVSNYDITSLKKIFCGAAPLGADITTDFLQRFTHGVKLNQGFGMTELSPVSNVDFTCTAGSIGHLVANTKGKIVHLETNKVLPPGEEGEYCVKGPQVMKGYFNNQKATDEMIESDGWLHTGDIGYFNKDGLVYIHDRLKELIKYKGSQVAPAELEAILLGHPNIQDAAVLGVPDDAAGELPKAFVVKKLGSTLSEEEIIKFVEGRVSSTKRLRGGVQFVDEIPKNPSGKILRRVLRTKYL
uniref:AMP-dependent synthetase/ligase domain-containing protein n=1 Tax=Arion vulgaris TaxID=1028688 RepID=A0A0B7BDP1_9EUPU